MLLGFLERKGEMKGKFTKILFMQDLSIVNVHLVLKHSPEVVVI